MDIRMDGRIDIQLTPDNSNLQGKSKKVRIIGSSSYRELRTNDHKVKTVTTCTRARAILFLQRSTFLNTVNLIIIGGNGIRNQMFLDTCIVQAERNVTIKKNNAKHRGKTR